MTKTRMSTEWKLWLDDLRSPAAFAPHETDYVWARDIEQAQYFVRMWGVPTFMALDHDLGRPAYLTHDEPPEDVMEFLKWLAAKYPDSCPAHNCHSANPQGVNNVNSFMHSWKRSLSL